MLRRILTMITSIYQWLTEPRSFGPTLVVEPVVLLLIPLIVGGVSFFVGLGIGHSIFQPAVPVAKVADRVNFRLGFEAMGLSGVYDFLNLPWGGFVVTIIVCLIVSYAIFNKRLNQAIAALFYKRY